MIVSTATFSNHTTFEELYNDYLRGFPLDGDVKEKDSTAAYNYVTSAEIVIKWEKIALFLKEHSYKTWDDLDLLVSCIYRTVVGPWTKLISGKKSKSKKTLVETKKLSCPKCGFCIEATSCSSSAWTINEVGKLSQHREECFKETQRTNPKLIKYIRTHHSTKSNTEVSNLASKTFNMSFKTHSYDQCKYYRKKKGADSQDIEELSIPDKRVKLNSLCCDIINQTDPSRYDELYDILTSAKEGLASCPSKLTSGGANEINVTKIKHFP